MDLLEDLGRVNDFSNFRHTPEANRGYFLKKKQQQDLAKKLSRYTGLMEYSEHTAFINFTEFNYHLPIYVNMIRDPIERVVSAYYYIRNPTVYKSILAKRPKAEHKKQDWFSLDFNDCVRRNYPECSYVSNTIPELTAFPHWERLASMFCGHEEECLYFNNRNVVQRAKLNVEQVYSVVGSWEDTNITLKVLEAYIPRFFRGVSEIYYCK